jgi:hypothetical protein
MKVINIQSIWIRARVPTVGNVLTLALREFLRARKVAISPLPYTLLTAMFAFSV